MVTPSTDLTVRSESVQKLYTDYLAGRYVVNRRYQRKLVWTVEEKRDLIDSILSDLPIPLILVAEITEHGPAGYELIDGMQRLNAIFSFIENEFDLDGKYFDLESLADTKDLRDDDKLIQKVDILPRELSRKISNYLLPISVFKAPTTAQVDKVFQRINSGGRRLSGQELRQAGSTSEIAQLVRVCASRIRGDSSSSDIVSLTEMPKLSINNRHLDYGVDVDSIFWVSQQILRRLDVRSSFDEQLILDILIDCLIDPLPSSGTDTRDSVYGAIDEDDETAVSLEQRVADRIDIYGKEKLEEDFFLVYDELRAVVGAAGETFVRLIVGRGRGGRYPRYFQAVYLAFWELIIRDGFRVASRTGAAESLRNIGTPRGQLSIPGGGGDWTSQDKRKNIDVVKGVLRSSFEKVPQGEERDAGRFGQASFLERVLANSVTEQSLCELKQGLLELSASRTFDSNSWEKILQEITAIANEGPNSIGYLIIGIADKEADVERVLRLDSINSVGYRGFNIVGIEREAKARNENLKQYVDWIGNKLSNCDLDTRLRSQVASSMSLIDYHGKAVLLIKISSGGVGPFFYKGKLYERSGAGRKEVPQLDYNRIFARFIS
ncbi:DUF262 domain-containing protein [Nonomuraea sp. NPDC050394]|uniref:GmrSD restriction endonuclease domain-containing protein n=1 Tax=Nonomuraea sp. NPDC050394 TaxID=3364363 RepID=UPI0037B33635